MDLVEPPQSNSQGTARLAFPIRLPRARGAYQPDVRLAYDSSGSNGWLGMGWDVPVSKVEVDTRFGAPYYDGEERYALNGEQLVPVEAQACSDGGSGRRYAPRVEREFRRIVRCGAGTTSYSWEVTDTRGTLFIHGGSDSARLADPVEGHIGTWMLEKVIDTNGNVAAFSYLLDQKGVAVDAPGASITAHMGEDFRQLYLSGIRYSGHQPSGESGAYLVTFHVLQTNGNFFERRDATVSGRLGFKVASRLLLGSISVHFNPSGDGGSRDEVIREYVLKYRTGEFGRMLLDYVDVYGLGGEASGAKLPGHGFEYTRARDEKDAGTFRPFGDAGVAWAIDAAENRGISSSTDNSYTAHTYFGVSYKPDKSSGSAGTRAGFTHRDSTVRAMFIDLNGDGLPDRVTPGKVLFNQATAVTGARSFASEPPFGDPGFGRTSVSLGSTTLSSNLGTEFGNYFAMAQQAAWKANAVSTGFNLGETFSTELLVDADGDGLVDVARSGQVEFNQRRGPGGCGPEKFCFSTARTIDVIGASNPAHQEAALEDRAEILKAFPLTDALLEWVVPFTGTVNVSGGLKRRYPMPADGGTGRDNVALRIYKAHRETVDAGVTTTPLSDTSGKSNFIPDPLGAVPTPVWLSGVSVTSGDRLYFRLSTVYDFPVGSLDGGSPSPLDLVNFAPTITYSQYCNPGCASVPPSDLYLREPTGAFAFRFDSRVDFRLAGDPFGALTVPAAGTVRVSSTISKAVTGDVVRLCVQRFPFSTDGGQPQPRPCAMSGNHQDPYARLVPSATTLMGEPQPAMDIAVEAGDSLVFRVESDLSIDPGAVTWAPVATMTQVCEPGANGTPVCRNPSGDELKQLTFDAQPNVQLHGRYSLLGVGEVPILPVVMPKSGTLEVVSSGGAIGYYPVFYSVRGPSGSVLKVAGYHQFATGEAAVQAGDQVYFEAHSEAGMACLWTPAAFIKNPAPDGGWDYTPVPITHQYCTSDSPGLVATGIPKVSPLSGGFHGWRYGQWTGGEAFDAALLTLVDGAQYADGGVSMEKLRDPDSDENKRMRAFAPLIPRRSGTSLQGDDGLAPGTPAFVGADRTVFITAEGMHGGRRGGVVKVGDTTADVAALFDLGDLARASRGLTLEGGVEMALGQSVSAQVSYGWTEGKSNLLDMNGDGVVDLVVHPKTLPLPNLTDLGIPLLAGAPPAVKLANPATLGVAREVPLMLMPDAGFLSLLTMRSSQELTFGVGLGLSAAVRRQNSRGDTSSVTAFAGNPGVGVGVNFSRELQELIDINGDGLPDHVRREGDRLLVRMNLGRRFAGQDDEIPIPGWTTGGTDAGAFDPVAEVLNKTVSVSTGGVQAIGTAVADLVDTMDSPDVMRRVRTLSINGSVGAGLNADHESFVYSASKNSDLMETEVALLDLTGDGLPDYVRKRSSDGSFRVRVNLGDRFGEEESWEAPQWPTGAALPAFELPPKPPFLDPLSNRIDDEARKVIAA
ncbi:MAG: SpvB/TcaC N-terminal domain-containing protein, partial [Myxococcaceae bacterium]